MAQLRGKHSHILGEVFIFNWSVKLTMGNSTFIKLLLKTFCESSDHPNFNLSLKDVKLDMANVVRSVGYTWF